MPPLRSPAALIALALLSYPVSAAEIAFGDNGSHFSEDGECDDRRFHGDGMSLEFDWEDATHDATDCQSLWQEGRISLWVMEDALLATDCDRIDFGSDASKYSHDGVCDDPRFEGWGAAEVLLAGDQERDASDCRRLCEFGLIGVREY